MSTEKQKAAARRNIKKAQEASAKKTTKKTTKKATKKATRKAAKRTTKKATTLSTAAQNRLPDAAFAFPKERKEPLTDARHVRNAVARFDQVEGVTDAERDRAWKRIKTAAKKFDVELGENSWRELFEGGKAKKR